MAINQIKVGNTTHDIYLNKTLTIQGNGTTLTNGTFNGSANKTVNITPSAIGAMADKPASIELAGASSNGGFVDFHYGQSTSDYTSRIIESASGSLDINQVALSNGNINAKNEYLSGSLYVGGKKSTTDGKTGVAFGSSGNITMQGSSAPTLNLITGTNTSASASIGTDSYKRLILKSSEVTRIQVMSNNKTCYQFAGDAFYYTGDNTAYLGGDGKRWKSVYAVTGTINTSDRNQKENIEEIDEKYEALFNKLKPVTYELKGNDHDRIHVGFISQDIKESMDEVGLTDTDFAGYCMDYKKNYNEETGEDELVLDENGNPIESYSLRYTEFIALNTHMIQKLMKRVEELEEKVAQFEGTTSK